MESIETKDRLTAQESRQVFYLNYFRFPATGGIYTHYIGKKYPAQGWVTLEAVTRLNTYKRALLASILPFANKNLLVSLWPIIFLPWKRKVSILNDFLESQNRLAYNTLQPDFYQPERYGSPARETAKLVSNFLTNLGADTDNTQFFGKVMGHIIEFDSAYRYRLLDLMAETSPELLKNPSKEIKRLLGIYLERDSRESLGKRFRLISGFLSIVFRIPKIQKAFIKATQASEFTNLQMTPADMYHVLTDNGKYEGGYDWGGKSKQERLEQYESFHDARVFDPLYSRTIKWYPPYKILSDLRFD